MAPINMLAGFQSQLGEMGTSNRELSRVSKNERASILGNCVSDCFWVLQSFLTARFKSQDFIF